MLTMSLFRYYLNDYIRWRSNHVFYCIK